MKHCNTCSIDKDLTEFHKRAASKDGLSPKCKQCSSEYDRSRVHLSHRVQARTEYSKTVNGKGRHTAAKIAYIERNPKKRAAHVAVGNALRDGVLRKVSYCESCGKNCDVAHHPDYNKPLDVMWLCNGCHVQWHKEHGEGLNG